MYITWATTATIPAGLGIHFADQSHIHCRSKSKEKQNWPVTLANGRFIILYFDFY
jgi:hypothetical protein